MDLKGENKSPGADPIGNIIHQRTDNAGGKRRPQQGQHHGPIGAQQRIKLVMVVEVPNHGIPAQVQSLANDRQRLKRVFVAELRMGRSSLTQGWIAITSHLAARFIPPAPTLGCGGRGRRWGLKKAACVRRL
jgi:hypothetical protein